MGSRPCRFSYNWLKLRAWELSEYDAVLLLDSDMTVVRPLSLLRSPT
jgi:alpha-N-acetylglucosamine transferase